MSTQKFWEAGPEQFQRPGRKDTLGTTPRQHYPVGPWWDTLLCQGAGKACSALQDIGTCDKWIETWALISTRKIPIRLWRTFLWWDPSPWRYSTLAWSGHDHPFPSLESSRGRGWRGGSRRVPLSHLPNSSQMGEGQQLCTLHSGETQARTPRLT